MADTGWRKWLLARPVAHRGLHDGNRTIVENTIAAAEAAIARRFAIECDVQCTADGQFVVFHDYDLERLTNGSGPLAARTASELRGLQFRNGSGHIPTLEEFLAIIDGRTPLVVEIKSDFVGNTRPVARLSQIIAATNTQVALKSFDPAIMAYLRQNQGVLGMNHVPLGMVAEASYDHPEWEKLSAPVRTSLTHFLHWEKTRPDFLSWNIADLPHATPNLLRKALDVPVMTWTVRTQAQRVTVMQWADQIVFEETDKLRVE